MWWKCRYLLFFFSEATFNTNGCILDPFFSLSMVQALVFFYQNWLYLTPIPINIRAFMDYIENSDMIELDDLSYKFKISYFIL